MHWEILIIPLIALGVWILGTLFKSGEDDKIKKGIRRPGNVSGRGSSRRPVTDLDRFLEEARRRREAEERPKPPSPPAPARPKTPRAPQRPAPPRETPRVAATVIRGAEVPLARPVAQPARAEPVVVASTRDAPLPTAPTTTRPTQASPILQQVHSLLSKPRTAGTAFVLREIFDRPLSMRRR
ncbi:MAG: hypothetical protein ACRELG_16215 [Gemmataceae bacterium]